jgi:hypothetical protein
MQEVYARYGLAMHHAQKLELSLVKLLVAFGVSVGTYDTDEKLQSAVVNLFGKTMGTLNKNLDKTGIDLTPLRDDLITALIRRNFLAHDYFRERPSQTLEGQAMMIRELADASILFEETGKRLEALLRENFEAQGIDISGTLDQRKPIVMTEDGYIIGNGSVALTLLAKERGDETHPTIKIDVKWETATEEERARLLRLADRLP